MEEFRKKKRFGQNFLHDRHVVERILDAAEISSTDRVLEIGPGLGALTGDLLARAAEVNVIEVDRELIEHWANHPHPQLQLHAGDALALDWATILPKPPYKLAANLPYNISTPILFRIIEYRQLFSRLVLMFQKEVGERLAASPGGKDYGVLSVFCQIWFDVHKVMNVPPGAFQPPPKVHSMVVRLDPLPAPRVQIGDEALFRRVVKGAFGQRRKTLRNALSGAGFDAKELETAFAAVGIDSQRRGETLALEEFSRLSLALERRRFGAENVS